MEKAAIKENKESKDKEGKEVETKPVLNNEGKEVVKEIAKILIIEGLKKLKDWIVSKINEKPTYSESITEHIRNQKELELYQNQGLQEGVINDKPCLITNIDLKLKDAQGLSNLERMKKGRPPIANKKGETYTLHHIGQDKNSPLAELKDSVHKKYDNILHDKNKPSNIDRDAFARQRAEYWKARAADLESKMAKN